MKYEITIRKIMENCRPLVFNATVEGDQISLNLLGNILLDKFPKDKYSHELLKEETISHFCDYNGKLIKN